MRKRPLIAILRGLRPDETEAAVSELIEAGFEAIEIPLNSPEPFRSIEIAARMAPAGALIGVFTATEALSALEHGASGLKFFPASVLGPGGIAAIRAILPSGALLCAVGGVGAADLDAYAAHGISAFGLGSNIYKPGDSAAEIGGKARKFIAAWDAAFAG